MIANRRRGAGDRVSSVSWNGEAGARITIVKPARLLMRHPNHVEVHMVSIRSVVIALATLVVLALASAAHADTIGPACWRPDGKLELYRLFFVLDPAQPTVAIVVGDARPEGTVRRPVSGSAIAGVAPNSVTMLLTVGLEPSGPAFSTTYFVRADFGLTDLTGTMVCQLPGGGGGCAQGSFDWTPVACP